MLFHFMRLLAFLLLSATALAQAPGARVEGSVMDRDGAPLQGVTVSLLRVADSSVARITASQKNGRFECEGIREGRYFLSFSATGHAPLHGPVFSVSPADTVLPGGTFRLQPATGELSAVRVTARRPLIEQRADRTIINVEASITNVGATALEVLEKSPGVTVNQNGGISLRGREGVLVMIDGKPVQLSGAELSTLLGGMNASSIDQIELITQPSARYDAAGNSGIINIKTKKNRQGGWNGNVSASFGQGRYSKTSNSLNLNYRNSRYNVFLTYNMNASRNFTRLYSDRTYFEADEKTPVAYFEQPAFITGKGWNHTLRTGIDLFLGKNTTVGVQASGFISPRRSNGYSPGYWSDVNHMLDSIVHTYSHSKSKWENGALNLNLQQRLGGERLLTTDLDHLRYSISNLQYFGNRFEVPGSTLGGEDALEGNLPGSITIRSAKADYSQPLGKTLGLETGWKLGRVEADNRADYMLMEQGVWKQDLEKTNHFLYEENIHAGYVNGRKQGGRWMMEAGLRYEHTKYTGRQLGNVLRGDSSFSRSYGALFPSGLVSFEADSNHTFSLAAGRRIDRPPFQKLNPFLFFLNKYTYQQGNPFIRPQFTTNLEFSHSYRNWLTTSVSYSSTKDYFSQLFYNRSGLIVYTEGNLASMRNIGFSAGAQLKPAPWWSLSLNGRVNYKEIKGVVVSATQTASLTYVSFNMSQQFRLPKGWSAELNGFYNGREQELQEVTFAFGQLSAGLAKQLWSNSATVRLSVRDMFFTGFTQGLTEFQQAEEYFRLERDSRVIHLAFNWRFGKAVKDSRRRNGSAGEEIQRVGI